MDRKRRLVSNIQNVGHNHRNNSWHVYSRICSVIIPSDTLTWLPECSDSANIFPAGYLFHQQGLGSDYHALGGRTITRKRQKRAAEPSFVDLQKALFGFTSGTVNFYISITTVIILNRTACPSGRLRDNHCT